MDNINVSLNEVRETSNEIRTYCKQIERIFEQLRVIVEQSNTFWDSQSSSTFRTKFQGLKSTFDNYCLIINEFALYLDNTCDKYELNEHTLTQNANAF